MLFRSLQAQVDVPKVEPPPLDPRGVDSPRPTEDSSSGIFVPGQTPRRPTWTKVRKLFDTSCSIGLIFVTAIQLMLMIPVREIVTVGTDICRMSRSILQNHSSKILITCIILLSIFAWTVSSSEIGEIAYVNRSNSGDILLTPGDFFKPITDSGCSKSVFSKYSAFDKIWYCDPVKIKGINGSLIVNQMGNVTLRQCVL